MKKYEDEVLSAFACLEKARVTTEGHLQVMHPQVVQAHKHLRHAVRIHRRQRATSWLVFWSEEYAVSLGYLTFDEVEKPGKNST